MVDVIVYKPSPYGLVFIHNKPLGFIIYHIKHERVYVSYNTSYPVPFWLTEFDFFLNVIDLES